MLHFMNTFFLFSLCPLFLLLQNLSLFSTHELDHVPNSTDIAGPTPPIPVTAESMSTATLPLNAVPDLPPRRPLRQTKPPEPRCYKEAQGSKEWGEAMKQELDALEKNDTWEADGSIYRHKARLVAKGYNQVAGVDYVDKFSPVAKAVTVRVFLALASSYSWPVHQVDINNAFLHGFLDEDIYMQAPAGYFVPKGHVCKLKRSLYGLKQASRQWNLELTSKLLAFGFLQSAHDHCLFIKPTDAGLIALLVYVDDILIACISESKITEVKDFLHSAFTIKDLGPAKYFLGLEIAQSSSGTSITQHKFIIDIISDTGLQSARPASSPLPLGLKLSAHDSLPLSDVEPYRRLVGRLLYLSFTLPGISFRAQQLSQYVHALCCIHIDGAMHLVRYLKDCPERGLFFPASNSLSLTAYCDADWASCTDSRRSLTGYCIFLGNDLVSWKTKKQTPVARLLFPLLFHDNQAAIDIVANQFFHERPKHLEIDCHLVRDKFKAGFVLPLHISGVDQLADIFMKSFSGSQFFSLLSKMGFVSFPQVHLEGGLKRISCSAMDDTSCYKVEDDNPDDVVLY
ncbi:UNVERIFIED_CONTAM: Retrovirus-related Pol polyprotein from transposon RE1 [Sesamum radiatum]|uniref:Retrovirus-related Pol polyprotein from transposon RE1 n=1 Tax=Sesamum radiatum TaxID=300843 RepID=A0AAW2THD5_SESRA